MHETVVIPPSNPSRRALLFALAIVPLMVRGQGIPGRKRLALVGFANMFDGPDGLERVTKGLAARGFAEGRQVDVVRVVVEPPRPDEALRGLDYLVPKLKQQVLPLKPDVIVVFGSIMAKGMHLATATIPIVTIVGDPIELGLAQSLARPGGNVTGMSGGVSETSVKVMEMLKRLVPKATRVAIFHDSRPVATRVAAHYERAARGLSLEPVMISSVEMDELVRAVRGLRARNVHAAVMPWAPDDSAPFFREALAARLPLIGVSEGDAERGALAAYFADDSRGMERIVPIVEQVLRGADPAMMPFQFPQTFRLVINRRSAEAIGVVVPSDLLVRADRVIE